MTNNITFANSINQSEVISYLAIKRHVDSNNFYFEVPGASINLTGVNWFSAVDSFYGIVKLF